MDYQSNEERVCRHSVRDSVRKSRCFCCSPQVEEVVQHHNEEYLNAEEENEEQLVAQRIVDKRERKFGRNTVTKYLIQWHGYDQTLNSWHSYKECQQFGCEDLIDEYEKNHPLIPKTSEKSFVDRALVMGCVLMASLFTYLFVSIIEFPQK